MLVVLAAVARALQHGGDGREAEALEGVDSHLAGSSHPFDACGPSLTVGDELGWRQRQILANEKDRTGCQDARAELLASCFECERVVPVLDEVGGILAVGELQRGRRGSCLGWRLGWRGRGRR